MGSGVQPAGLGWNFSPSTSSNVTLGSLLCSELLLSSKRKVAMLFSCAVVVMWWDGACEKPGSFLPGGFQILGCPVPGCQYAFYMVKKG